MKPSPKLSVGLLLASPVAAYADGAPHVIEAMYAFGGAFVGGLVGALVACWLCKRQRGSGESSDTRK